MNQCRTIWDGDDGMKISPFKKCCCPSSLIVTSERQFIFIAILFKWYIEIWGGPWFRFFNWSESDTVFPNPTILQVYEDLSVSIFARWQGWKDHVYLGPGHVWGGSSKIASIYSTLCKLSTVAVLGHRGWLVWRVRGGHTGQWSPVVTLHNPLTNGDKLCEGGRQPVTAN